ncbi:hypothetical protein [Marinibacterium profundimaris]|uniref:hypothetical protein n=1 Tax=Marinibacterium profundimaris TaxID=1679460 RepID=UPI001303C09D|nr:hypothetical protein [Marinibacterium profundimaris]
MRLVPFERPGRAGSFGIVDGDDILVRLGILPKTPRGARARAGALDAGLTPR